MHMHEMYSASSNLLVYVPYIYILYNYFQGKNFAILADFLATL